MNELQLIPYNSEVLHTPCMKWDFMNPAFDLADFSEKLVDAMRKNRGIGLSANQVGVNYKIFAMDSVPTYVVINPKIINVSDEMITLEEGCLSYPGLIMKVRRPIWIEARFNYPNGQAGTHRFEGMSARVFLHEYDHIEFGHTFFDAATSIHKEQGITRWKKILRSKKNASRLAI
jgi:peptide deformylase